jgi:hypothetical protein
MSGLRMKYFVLKPENENKPDDVFAEASREAMLVYAKVISETNPDFAKGVRKWVAAIENRVGRRKFPHYADAFSGKTDLI